MGYEVLVTEPAEVELDEALSYLVTYLGSPVAAKDLADAYEQALGLLETMPFAMAERSDYSAVCGVQVRCVRVRGFLLLYHVDEATCRVWVDSFMHESMDVAYRLRRRGISGPQA